MKLNFRVVFHVLEIIFSFAEGDSFVIKILGDSAVQLTQTNPNLKT